MLFKGWKPSWVFVFLFKKSFVSDEFSYFFKCNNFGLNPKDANPDRLIFGVTGTLLTWRYFFLGSDVWSFQSRRKPLSGFWLQSSDGQRVCAVSGCTLALPIV